MKKIIYTLAACTALGLAGCNIDRAPHGQVSSEKIEKDPTANLKALLNGAYAQMKPWSDVMHRCGEYAGDNIMIRGTSTDAFYEFISFSRTPNNYRLTSFWNSSYKAIAQCSNIINMIPEGKDAEINNQIGEAYYIRGMMYFYLVRAYGRPYFQSPDKNLGVPIVNGTPEDVFQKYPDRSTVSETYKQVIADLEKSIQLLTKDRGNTYASKTAAQAMLSRVYLFMSGTYENPNQEYARLAQKYADEVIVSGKYELLPREQFMKYNRLTPDNNKETIFAIRRIAAEFSGYDHYYGVGGMYANIGGMGWGEMYASAKYIELLDETGRNDWLNGKIVDARAAFIEPQYTSDAKKVFRFVHNAYDKSGVQTNYNYAQLELIEKGSSLYCKETIKDKTTEYALTPVDAAQGIYSIKYSDGKTYKGVTDNFIALNRVYPMFYITKCSREGEESHLHSPVITRLGEIYLNKAEAAAKLGDYGTALNALNAIRERSLPGKGYKQLTKDTAGKLIDKERQLELAFQAERSYDVFRNGDALNRKYPGPHKAMEQIPATDYRVIYFIPTDAIDVYNSTGSKLTQNPTSN